MNTKAVIYHITDWLKSYANNAKIEGFVVGVSGGIDSAVTSTLCAKTGFPTLVLNMPIHQKSTQFTRSNEHIKWLENTFSNVKGQEVDLTEIFNS